MSDDPVTIRLLDREFRVACSKEERAGLVAAGDYLGQRMQELRDKAGSPGFDRIVVLAALAICNDYLRLENTHQQGHEQLGSTIEALTQKLEQALASETKGSG